MVKQGFFITGTDTGVGKTYVTACLLDYFRQQGKSTVALKPVASGIDLAQQECGCNFTGKSCHHPLYTG